MKLSFDENSKDIILDIEQEREIESFFAAQRNQFDQLITAQRMGIQQITIEPTFISINNFSSTHYTTLIEQQMDICQILHSIDASVSYFIIH